MMGNFDYNNDEVMKILENANYTDEQKKQLFEQYKANLKDLRKKEIINRLNECAKNNPIITQEEYVNFLKKYNDDDLSKPFEVIEKELNDFSVEMDNKYKAFMIKKEEEKRAAEREAEKQITPDVVPEVVETNEVETPVVESPLPEEPAPEVEEEPITPSVDIEPTVFENKEVKEVMPEEIGELQGEKGSASAIIISIIAIIIGIVIMYAIIKLR